MLRLVSQTGHDWAFHLKNVGREWWARSILKPCTLSALFIHQNGVIDWAWERVPRVPPFGLWKPYSPSGSIRCETLGSLQAHSGLFVSLLLCPLVGLYVAFTFLNKVIDMKEFCGWRQQPQRTPSLKSAKGKHMEPSKECSNKNWNIWRRLPSPLYFSGIIVSRREGKSSSLQTASLHCDLLSSGRGASQRIFQEIAFFFPNWVFNYQKSLKSNPKTIIYFPDLI